MYQQVPQSCWLKLLLLLVNSGPSGFCVFTCPLWVLRSLYERPLLQALASCPGARSLAEAEWYCGCSPHPPSVEGGWHAVIGAACANYG